MKGRIFKFLRKSVGLMLLASMTAMPALVKAQPLIYGNNGLSPDVAEKFDLDTGALLQAYPVSPGFGRGLVVVGNVIYTSASGDTNIYMTDAITGASLGYIPIQPPVTSVSSLAWDGSNFWALDYSGLNNAYKIDILGNVVKTVSLRLAGGYMDGLEYFNGELIVNRGDGGVEETGQSIYDVYDLDGNVVQTDFITAPNGTGIAFDGSYFYVSNIYGIEETTHLFGFSTINVFDSLGHFVKTINLGTPYPNPIYGRLIEDLSVDYSQRADTAGSGSCAMTCPQVAPVCNDPGQCGAIVHFPAPALSGDCGVVRCSPASGSFFPVGNTTVICTAKDTSGHVLAACSFVVTVNDCEPPLVDCPSAVNPSGKTDPNAGVPKNPQSGNNPDGFYQLFARDNCDGTNLQIYVKDSAEGPCGGGFQAGPYAPGTIVKLTQSPGQASVRPMAGVVVAHINTMGDPVLVVKDSSGNTSCHVCLVAPPPK